MDILDDGASPIVATPLGPLVHMAATGWFRTNGRGPAGEPEIEDEHRFRSRRTKTWLWQKIWARYRSLMGGALPVDAAALGQINGSALFAIAADCAPRRRSPRADFCAYAYDAESAFVHLEDLLGQLLPIGLLPQEDRENLDSLLAAFGRDATDGRPYHAWTTYQRFWRIAEQGFTRADLIKAFHDRYAIVGAVGQTGWDLVIPVYCGDPNEAFDPSVLTWIQIQIKNADEGKGSTEMRPVDIAYGGIIDDGEVVPSRDGVIAGAANGVKTMGTAMEVRERETVAPPPEPGAKVQPDTTFRPRFPPIMLWLALSGPGPAHEGGGKAQVPPNANVKVRESTHKSIKYWSIVFPSWDNRNHPVLADWDGPFPCILHEGPSMALFDGTYRREQVDELERRGIYEG